MPVYEIFHDFAFDYAQVDLRILFLLQILLFNKLRRHDQNSIRVEQITTRLALMQPIRTLVLVSARLYIVARLHFLHDLRLKIIIAQISARHTNQPVRGASRQVDIDSSSFANIANARFAVLSFHTVASAWLFRRFNRVTKLPGHILHAFEYSLRYGDDFASASRV